MDDTLQRAIAAIKAGDKPAGQRLLIEFLKADQHNEAAWLWMAATVDEAEEKRDCLEHALALNPQNKHTQQALAQLTQVGVELPPVDLILAKTTPRAKCAVAPPPIEDEPVPKTGITIEFLHSGSQTFEFAIRAASSFPTYRKLGDRKRAMYRVTVPVEEIESLGDLLDYMKGWRNRSVYINGEKLPWNTIFLYRSCYCRRKASYGPTMYCFGFDDFYYLNFFGCLHSGMPFHDNADWLTIGKWISSKGDWEFDKDHIRQQLERNLFHYRFCPALDQGLLEVALDALPARINPDKDKGWAFMTTFDPDRKGLKRQVRMYGCVREETAIGVQPQGYDALEEIWRCINCQRSDVMAYIPMAVG